MTANQLKFHELNETRRSNQMREANTQSELSETARSNRAKELETNRSNLAKEAETFRSNKANEKIKTYDQIRQTLFGRKGVLDPSVNPMGLISKSIL